MNAKTLAPLGVALVLGLIAALVAMRMMGKPKDGGVDTTARIVTLKRDLVAGQEITPEDVTATALSSPVAPPGTFTNVADVVGRVAIAPMSVNQPVLAPLLAPRGTVGGLQALVPIGMRAITIDVTETTGVGGLIVPGCLVDVLITLGGDNVNGPLSKTLVQGLKVSAVGQRMGAAPKDAPAEMFRTATLLVTPSQAETIELASSNGRLRLVLRSSNDTGDAQTTGVTLSELRGTRHSNSEDLAATHAVMNNAPSTQPAPQAVAVPVEIRRESPPRRIVKIIKGGVESTVTFEAPRSNDGHRTAPGMVVSNEEAEIFAE
jgi:pilus assembly protein CpaB